MPRSSECTFLGPDWDAKKVIRGCELVSKLAVVTPLAHTAYKPASETIKCTLQELLKKEPVAAVSVPKNIDSDSVTLQNGKLNMLLNPETFYTFGMPGEKLGKKYSCTVDLNKETKLYKRFQTCLQNLSCEYTFVYRLEDGIKASIESTGLASLPCPDMQPEELNKDAIDDWFDEFQQWIGLCMANYSNTISNASNTLTPEQSEAVNVSVVNSVLRSGEICDLWTEISEQPWSVVFAQGFSNVPIVNDSGKVHIHQEIGYILVKVGDKTTCLKFK